MNIQYKFYNDSHQQYDDIEQFAKVHKSICTGVFKHTIHEKKSSTHQKRCEKCGSVAYSEITTFRDQTKLLFKGFIPLRRLGIEPTDRTKYGTKQYNCHCVGCGIMFPSNVETDYCPNCNNDVYEESYINYDAIAESHANAVISWQQGAIWEIGHTEHEQSDYATAMKHMARARELTQEATQSLKMSRYITETHDQHTPYDSFMSRMNAHMATSKAALEKVQAKTFFKSHRETMEHAEKVRLAKLYQAQNEEEAAARQCDYMGAHGFYDMADRLTMNYHAKQARENVLTSTRHMKAYNVYRARTAPATTQYKQAPTKQATFTQSLNPDLRECCLSDITQLPAQVEVIEVTRAKNHILSPSWKVLKQYKIDGDWQQYTAAFMAEMAQPAPIKTMKEIINRSKQHPVYLACFEKVGHCHRFLLLDWMNRLSKTC